jgi:hypothetical protein
MFETFSAVILIIVFLVPGFVWRVVEGKLIYLDKALEWEKFALGLLTRSAFVYLPFSPLILHGWKERWIETYPIWTGAAAIGFLVVLPSLYALASGAARQKALGAKILQQIGLKTFEQHHIPTAWDYLFSKFEPAWVVVTLKNGNKIYGFMSTNSYLSSDPKERDIYISHMLSKSAEGALEFVNNTRGVYIHADEVSVIEFTNP